ncbi:hypothetical protein NSQ54_00435 [Alkalihalobacillus sp. FSL W8-0930]
MKKLIMLIAMMSVWVVGCSSNADVSEENEPTEEARTAEEDESSSLSEEVIFEYNHEGLSDYDLQSLRTSASGETSVITGHEDIDRVSEYYTYVIDPSGEAVEGRKFALEEDVERRCVDMAPSPNGQYLLYNCHDEGIEFSVYDLEKDELIHQALETDDYVDELAGITDDLVVYMVTDTIDRELFITLYDVTSEEKTDFLLSELLETDDISLNGITPTADGSKVLIDTVLKLHLLDVESGEVTELASVEEAAEEFDSNNMFIYSATMSPDGKYLYYLITENRGSDSAFEEHYIMNLESGETDAYESIGHDRVIGFDINGNMLLKDDDQLVMHNLDTEETRALPDDIDLRSSTGFHITINGDYVFYTDKDSEDDDTYTSRLFRVALGDIGTYGESEFKAVDVRERDEPEQDEITLTEQNANERDVLREVLESSTRVMYPTEFPETLDYRFNHTSEESYWQRINLDTSEYAKDQIDFRAYVHEDEDRQCRLEDNAEVVDTMEGSDIYFYEFGNDDVELSVKIDNICYRYEARKYSQEEMIAMAKSMKPIEEPFHDMPIEEQRFPTLLPIQEVESMDPRLSTGRDGEIDSYFLEYKGEGTGDLTLKLTIKNGDEPSFFMNEEHGEFVELEGWETVFYVDDYTSLQLFDGTYYYEVEFDINNDILQAYGPEHVKETLIEIGDSFQ